MADEIKVDICVIGAGSGGLTVAAGASQMGAKVVLIERGPMGGDCLNEGCVPSKSLLAAAHAAQGIRDSGRFGVNGGEPAIDFAAVHGHGRSVIDGIAPHDSVERYEGLGVRVIQAAARFTAPDRVAAGELPPVAERVPAQPSVVVLLGDRTMGRHGGELRMLIGLPRDDPDFGMKH